MRERMREIDSWRGAGRPIGGHHFPIEIETDPDIMPVRGVPNDPNGKDPWFSAFQCRFTLR